MSRGKFVKKKVAVLGNGSPLFQEKVENVGKGRKVVPPRGYPQGTKLYSSCDATSALSLLLEEKKKGQWHAIAIPMLCLIRSSERHDARPKINLIERHVKDSAHWLMPAGREPNFNNLRETNIITIAAELFSQEYTISSTQHFYLLHKITHHVFRRTQVLQTSGCPLISCAGKLKQLTTAASFTLVQRRN